MKGAICFILLTPLFLFSTLVSAQDSSPIHHIHDFRLEKLDGNELIVSFVAKLDCSRKVSLNIKKGKLYKDGEYMGSFKLLERIRLRNKSQENIKVRVQVTLEKDLKVLEESLKVLMGQSPELKMTGKLKVTWFIFWKKYPFEHRERISLKNLLNR